MADREEVPRPFQINDMARLTGRDRVIENHEKSSRLATAQEPGPDTENPGRRAGRAGVQNGTREETAPGAFVAQPPANVMPSTPRAGGAGVKVRKGSRPVGRALQRPFTRKDAYRIGVALDQYSRTLRRPGQRSGAPGTLSQGAIRLGKLLAELGARYGGRVWPTATWLAEQLGVARKSVHAWKAQLAEHGFLQWERRYIRTGLLGRPGPQVQQTSNRYHLSLPRKAADLLGHIFRLERTDEAKAAGETEVQRLIREGCRPASASIAPRESPPGSQLPIPSLSRGLRLRET